MKTIRLTNGTEAWRTFELICYHRTFIPGPPHYSVIIDGYPNPISETQYRELHDLIANNDADTITAYCADNNIWMPSHPPATL